MRSTAQILASQSNGKQSLGPVTEDGRRRSSANSRSHGIFASELILPNEDPEDFHDILEAIENRVRPKTAEETELVRELAMVRWRMRRVLRLEAAVMAAGTGSPEQLETQMRGVEKVSRYEGRLRRGEEKTEARLAAIQEQRREAAYWERKAQEAREQREQNEPEPAEVAEAIAALTAAVEKRTAADTDAEAVVQNEPELLPSREEMLTEIRRHGSVFFAHALAEVLNNSAEDTEEIAITAAA